MIDIRTLEFPSAFEAPLLMRRPVSSDLMAFIDKIGGLMRGRPQVPVHRAKAVRICARQTRACCCGDRRDRLVGQAIGLADPSDTAHPADHDTGLIRLEDAEGHLGGFSRRTAFTRHIPVSKEDGRPLFGISPFAETRSQDRFPEWA